MDLKNDKINDLYLQSLMDLNQSGNNVNYTKFGNLVRALNPVLIDDKFDSDSDSEEQDLVAPAAIHQIFRGFIDISINGLKI